eukprot:scaffold26385_cov82-Phaeocystis_antarctica.AAC.5
MPASAGSAGLDLLPRWARVGLLLRRRGSGGGAWRCRHCGPAHGRRRWARAAPRRRRNVRASPPPPPAP